MTRIEKAIETNKTLRLQQESIRVTIPTMLTDGIKVANGDAAKSRTLAAVVAPAAAFLATKEWMVGLSTSPGDLVYDPEKNYVYVYSGKDPMTHTNPLFYPGASGVYYWAIIPKTKDTIKVYPGISGIVVSVKHHEIWWDVSASKKYKWLGSDNQNCVWPPTAGNEWEEVM